MNGQDFTVLISSVSKKVPLIKEVRKALNKLGAEGRIVGADADSGCIGKYFVDKFWEMPPLSELTPEDFISYCLKNKINRVIPTRDGELQFFAKYKDQFSEAGIEVMISSEEAVTICLDKLRFYQTIQKMEYPVIETTTTIDELSCEACVVKERYGAGARDIGLQLTKAEAQKHRDTLNNPIFQPFVEGEEISVDIYVDRSGKTKGVIARKRELVVAGESQVTTTFRDEELEKISANIAEELNLYGHVLLQYMWDKKSGVFHVLECNPRFGGASRLSLEVGLDSFYWHFLEAAGGNLSDCPFKRSTEEMRLVRYPEDLIQRWPN